MWMQESPPSKKVEIDKEPLRKPFGQPKQMPGGRHNISRSLRISFLQIRGIIVLLARRSRCLSNRVIRFKG